MTQDTLQQAGASQALPLPLITYLSLGWGVQSFCIAAMIALGHLRMITLAVHADTGHESIETYRFAERWTPWLLERGLSIVTVQSAYTDIVRQDWGIGSIMIPAFTKDRDPGEQGQVPRQCTHDWKVMPIRRHVRSLLPQGQPKPGSVESWQGISWDEIRRMRSSDVQYINNVYPLIEKRMTRADCITWLQAQELEVPPKSACTFCPFHSVQQWKDMKRKGGHDWKEAVAVDLEIRQMRKLHEVYVHPTAGPCRRP